MHTMKIRILLIIMIQVKAAILGKKTGYNEGKQIEEEDKILKTAHRLLYTKYPPYDHTVIGRLNTVRYPQKMIFWSTFSKENISSGS
jgi:hypothetical protein